MQDAAHMDCSSASYGNATKGARKSYWSLLWYETFHATSMIPNEYRQKLTEAKRQN